MINKILNTLSDNILLCFKYYRRFGLFGLKMLYLPKFWRAGLTKLEYKTFTNPIYIRNKSSDNPTFDQCILIEDYNFNLGFEPKTIIDLGANIGLSTVYFANRYKESKIVAVEPDNENYELMLRNIEKYPNIIPVKSGVWNKECYLKVNANDGNFWGFTVEECQKDENGAFLAVTIDKLMKLGQFNHIDLLKIDIEGAEKILFQSDYESWIKYIKVIIIELHDKTVPGCSKSFFNAINNLNYSIWFRGENIIIYMDSLSRPPKKRVKVF